MRLCWCSLWLALMAAWQSAACGGTIRSDRDPQLYLDLAAQPKYASVGMVESRILGVDYISSGTLVAPNFVLTAAHSVDHASTLSFLLGGQSYTGMHWTAFPSWTGNLAAGYDIGLVQLNAPVLNVAPAIRYTGTSEIGSLATSVGFGKSGTGLSGATSYDGQKRAGTNAIDGFYLNGQLGQRILMTDFDNPQAPSASSLGSKLPTSLEYLIAAGDSGGGMFIDTPSGTRLAGVHSFGISRDPRLTSEYGDTAGDTRVSAFNNWIDDVIRGTSLPFRRPFASSGTFGYAGGYAMSVPEPSSLVVAATGFFALLGCTRRLRASRRRATASPAPYWIWLISTGLPSLRLHSRRNNSGSIV